MIRPTTLRFALAAILTLAAIPSEAAIVLTATVGPGFTISLKKGTAIVKTLAAGVYTIKVADKSNMHNFHLAGPGVNKSTTVSMVGNATWSVKLSKGRTYTYVCDPHKTSMKGSFRVI